MRELIINFPELITSHSFFKEILPQLPDDSDLGKYEDIVFNFTGTDKIYSESISKIITLGMSLNKKTNKTIFFYFSWKPSLLSELDDMGLFHFINKQNVFELSNIGGYTPKLGIKAEINKFSNCDEFINITMRDETMLFNFIDLFLLDNNSGVWYLPPHIIREKATRFFKELVQNSFDHAKSECVMYLEINRYRKLITISDFGKGLNKSLELKKEVLKINERADNSFERDLMALVNAIFFRMDEENKDEKAYMEDLNEEDKLVGLYHISRVISQEKLYLSQSNKASIKFYNGNCYLIVNHKDFAKYYSDPNGFYNYVYSDYKGKLGTDKENYSRVKKFDKRIEGFHIEISYPYQSDRLVENAYL